MAYYYTALSSRSHAFLLERRMKSEGINCEITYMPREIMIDVCNMGVRFQERDIQKALQLIWRSGLPGLRVYREEILPNECRYYEV